MELISEVVSKVQSEEPFAINLFPKLTELRKFNFTLKNLENHLMALLRKQ